MRFFDRFNKQKRLAEEEEQEKLEKLLSFKPKVLVREILSLKKGGSFKGGIEPENYEAWGVRDISSRHYANSRDGYPIFEVFYTYRDEEGELVRVSYKVLLSDPESGHGNYIPCTGRVTYLVSNKEGLWWEDYPGERDNLHLEEWGISDLLEGNFRHIKRYDWSNSSHPDAELF